MTPDNLSFIWAVLAFGALVALLERFSRPIWRQFDSNDQSAFDHDEYHATLARWDARATIHELREADYAERQEQTVHALREHVAAHWGSE